MLLLFFYVRKACNLLILQWSAYFNRKFIHLRVNKINGVDECLGSEAHELNTRSAIEHNPVLAVVTNKILLFESIHSPD